RASSRGDATSAGHASLPRARSCRTHWALVGRMALPDGLAPHHRVMLTGGVSLAGVDQTARGLRARALILNAGARPSAADMGAAHAARSRSRIASSTRVNALSKLECTMSINAQ